MKLMKKLLALQIFALTILLSFSCKTKQELAEEKKHKEVIEQRALENEELFSESGLDEDKITELVENMKDIDEKVMNFMSTDPDNKAKSALLKKMTKERETKIRASMTEEEYRAYRKAVYDKKMEKSKKHGLRKEN